MSFDYDHDADLKTLFVGQARLPATPYQVADWSIKSASAGWRADARRRIRASDVVAVICGAHMGSASGVAIELRIAQEERIPYFLLAGRANGQFSKPIGARATDKVYQWTWDNVAALIAGDR